MAADSEVHGGYIDAVELLLFTGALITEVAFIGALHRDDNITFQALLDHGWDINSMEFGQLRAPLRTLRQQLFFLENYKIKIAIF
jgi:hypothetical protein